ncbi:MAG: hypothetical protein CHACPFDD_03755 [Phycisphaerae bacterium]|nr:hypothetical protein [Phycisphaerae bacterium]
MNTRIWIGVAVAVFASRGAFAQEEPSAPSEVDRLIESGAVSALEARLGKTPDDLARIAQAAQNKARRTRKAEEREPAWEDAEKRYLAVAKALGDDKKMDATLRSARLARIWLEYVGMIMSGWADSDLNTFEISEGRTGDRARLLAKLQKARQALASAGKLIDPLYDDRNAREDEFLSLGIASDVRNFKPDSIFKTGYVNLYIGVVATDAAERETALKASEKAFQTLIDEGLAAEQIYQCQLGLGVALREQGRFDDGLRHLKLAGDEGADPAMKIQARYETGRTLIKAGRFDEARAELKPLTDKDPEKLPVEERAGVFYVHLAHLVEANSFLEESRALLRAASGAGRKAVETQARRARETGLGKLNRLAGQGGTWPAVVRLYVTADIKPDTDPRTLTTTELRFAAQKLSEEKKQPDALRFLVEAASRKGEGADVSADVLYDLAVCHYQLGDIRSAAQTFVRLAETHPRHAKAAQAASFAFKCWAQLAEESKSKADYAQLAVTLRLILDKFPDSKDAADASWWLPVALQAAGAHDEAAQRFAEVSKSSPRYDEAQYHRVVCARLSLEQKRAKLDSDAYTAEARGVIGLLRDFAASSATRAASEASPDKKKSLLSWSADTLINAAELAAAGDVGLFQDALDSLARFEATYPESDQLGRVLGARIRAYRGLKDFDQASKLLEQYLATVPPERTSGVLLGLARGMQDEVEKLRESGRVDDARALAGEAVATFEQLLKTVAADSRRAADRELVSFGLARMLYLAGQSDRARQTCDELLAANPRNGNYQKLKAEILTAIAESQPQELAAAQQAWGELLKDPGLRKRAPQLYWEARLAWLSLHLRLGQAAEVESAIRQERVWYPDLGGAPWQERLETLYRAAAEKAGVNPAEPPPTATAPAPESP